MKPKDKSELVKIPLTHNLREVRRTARKHPMAVMALSVSTGILVALITSSSSNR